MSLIKGHYKPLRAYNQRIRMMNCRFSCPDCRSSGTITLLSPGKYEEHCMLAHGFDSKIGCAWCKRYFWTRFTKYEHADHLKICAESFFRQQSMVDIYYSPSSVKSFSAEDSESLLAPPLNNREKIIPPEEEEIMPEEAPEEEIMPEEAIKPEEAPEEEAIRKGEEEIRILRNQIDETRQDDDAGIWKELHRLRQEKLIELYGELRQIYLGEIAAGKTIKSILQTNLKILTDTMENMKVKFEGEIEALKRENNELRRIICAPTPLYNVSQEGEIIDYDDEE